MATFDAARALRREHEFGSIQPGLRADVVILRKERRFDTMVNEIAFP